MMAGLDGRPLPPRYPGTWNVWTTEARHVIERPFSTKPGFRSHAMKQLLTNEIGDYADQVDKKLRKKIIAEIEGKTWHEIPLIVHMLVCPECRGKTTYHQPSLFGD